VFQRRRARDEAATLLSSNVDASVGRLSASQTAPVKGARSGGRAEGGRQRRGCRNGAQDGGGFADGLEDCVVLAGLDECRSVHSRTSGTTMGH
jgi:hypothetical protein